MVALAWGKWYNGGDIVDRQNALDNRSQQLNPNNDAYWQSRGLDERPDDWVERKETENPRQQEDANNSGQHR